MKTTLYYFSGTGNSLKIARDLSERIEESELVPIAKIWQKDHIASTSEKVGLIFPLYYFGLPKIVYDFVNKIELDKTNYLFAVITRGGDLDGVPFEQLEEILRKKSKTLSAGFFIQMPNNYVIVPDITPEEIQKKMFNKAKYIIENITECVKENRKNIEIDVNEKKKKRLERVNNTFRKSVLENDKFFFADDNCNTCGVCEKICPVNNILLVEGKPQWQHKCQQCLACINFCPENSIQYGKQTIGIERYCHPDISVKDLINQNR